MIAILNVMIAIAVESEEEAAAHAASADKASLLQVEHVLEMHGLNRDELGEQIRMLGCHLTIIRDANLEPGEPA